MNAIQLCQTIFCAKVCSVIFIKQKKLFYIFEMMCITFGMSFVCCLCAFYMHFLKVHAFWQKYMHFYQKNMHF